MVMPTGKLVTSTGKLGKICDLAWRPADATAETTAARDNAGSDDDG
jgi:hypothetical protein